MMIAPPSHLRNALRSGQRVVAAALFCAMAGIAQAQSAAPYLEVEGMDFDTLAACAVVYQGVAGFATERPDETAGDPQALAREMSGASRAYAAVAYHVLALRQGSPAQAWSRAERRMGEIAEALAEQAGDDEGALDLMSEWVPYCDTLGSSVTAALEARSAQGW